MTDGRSTPQDRLDVLRARLPEYLVPATVTVLDRSPLRATPEGLVVFSRNPFRWQLSRPRTLAGTGLYPGFPIRKPTNLIAYASVPARTTGWLIQAKGSLIPLRPTGRDELTE